MREGKVQSSREGGMGGVGRSASRSPEPPAGSSQIISKNNRERAKCHIGCGAISHQRREISQLGQAFVCFCAGGIRGGLGYWGALCLWGWICLPGVWVGQGEVDSWDQAS